MRRFNTAHLCKCALFAVLAVLFQSAPVFLPLAGMFLSPLATLPAALAIYESKPLGTACYFASGAILFLIYPEEALIFLLATGIMGVPLGIFAGSVWKSVAATAGVLFAGMNLLTSLAGISIFGSLTPGKSFCDSLAPYLMFSLGYSFAWTLLLKPVFRIHGKTGSSLFR